MIILQPIIKKVGNAPSIYIYLNYVNKLIIILFLEITS